MEWNTLWQKVGGRRHDSTDGIIWEPLPAIVLSAWNFSSDTARAERFCEHLHWAAANGTLEIADAFLRSLPTEAWHHSSSAKSRYA